MAGRFDTPAPGAPSPVRFPLIEREVVGHGLDVWSIAHTSVPVVTVRLVLGRGTSNDPDTRHGLASLTGDLIDEGAGTRDAIELADAFARLGTELEIDVAPDATSIGMTVLARFLEPALQLLADVVIRPRLAQPDFARVRELRINRLRQLSQSASTMADRVYVAALFGAHPYGHGALGTTASLAAVTLDDAHAFWAGMYGPQVATLIVSGDVRAADAVRAAERAFGGWMGQDDLAPPTTAPAAPSDPRILLIDRPGAPQSELRLGHIGPPRATRAYHALVTLNALLGGQFTSRINRTLREEKGVTYGARTSFDFRRVGGTFMCETSVQSDATAASVADVLVELEEIRRDGAVSADELNRGQASLTRGYVRNFETADQLVRAAAQLATYSLPDDTFNRFVSSVEAVTIEAIQQAALAFVRPADATAVVVGDAATCHAPLEALGRSVVVVKPEF